MHSCCTGGKPKKIEVQRTGGKKNKPLRDIPKHNGSPNEDYDKNITYKIKIGKLHKFTIFVIV